MQWDTLSVTTLKLASKNMATLNQSMENKISKAKFDKLNAFAKTVGVTYRLDSKLIQEDNGGLVRWYCYVYVDGRIYVGHNFDDAIDNVLKDSDFFSGGK